MPSKKKMEFNNIVKEFGFPTSIRNIENTYKSDCFFEGSKLWFEVKDFEREFNEEIERQNNTTISKPDKEQASERYYRFQEIFLKHEKIFDPELYLLQMSILMEKDNSTRRTIKAILENKGIRNPSNEVIDALFVKDNNAISNLIQMFSVAGMNIRESMKIAQFFKSNNISSPNVYLPVSNKRDLSSLINTVRNRLINSDVAIIEVFNSNSENSTLDKEVPTFNFNVVNSQVHIGNTNFLAKKEKENQKRYEKATREINLEERLKKITYYDLRYVFRYPNLGILLSEFLYKNMDDSQRESREILNTIKQNLKYIDFDKLLHTILQVEFDKYGEDVCEFTYSEAQDLKKLSDEIGGLLENKKVKINSDRFAGGISFEELYAGINTLKNSYVAGKFFTEEELNSLASDYINGIKDVQTLTPDEFKNVLRFTENEILAMLKRNPNLLEYLIKNNIIENDKQETENKPDKLLELLEKQENITDKQLQILYENDRLTPEYLLQLYMDKGKADISAIKSLKRFVDEDFFGEIVNTSKLVELYLDRENGKEKFDKYRRLYKILKIDDKTIEEKNDISEDILNQEIELLKDERIMELYTLGLITIDTVIDYTGGNTLKQLYLSNELKPIDARRLYYSGIIKEDMLKTIMLDTSIDEGRKITLLYSTFPDVEDTDIMKSLEACLREVTENMQTFSSTLASGRKQEKRDTNDSSEDQIKKLKKAYEPRAKYRLISIIDEEYKFQYNEKDGTAIFFFPNREEYLIEKLYDKDRKPATNAATYILSKDVYEQNKDEFYQDGRINISKLYALKNGETKGIKRFIHTGWANAIVKYYDLDNIQKYSRQQIIETQKLAEQVEKSKREIER